MSEDDRASDSRIRLPLPLTRVGWGLAALPLLTLAGIGFALPLIPGLPFALLGALCLLNASPGMHRRLRRVPLLRPSVDHWRRARGRSLRVQLAVAGWLLALGVLASLEVARDTLTGRWRPAVR